MSGAVALELCVGRVPTIGGGVSLRRHVIRVAVVIELLRHIPGADFLECLVAIVAEPVDTIDGHVGERKGHGLLLGRSGSRSADHYDGSLYGEAVVRSVVTDHITFETVAAAHGVLAGIGFLLFYRQRSIHPLHLPVLRATILIGHPQAVGQTGRRAYRAGSRLREQPA